MKFYVFLLLLLIVSCQSEPTGNNELSQDAQFREENAVKTPSTGTIDSLILDFRSPLYTTLFSKFNIQSRIQRFQREYGDSATIDVTIFDKKSGDLVQEFNVQSHFLYFDSAYFSNNVRSYITGENVNLPVVDNDYGDILIADFNFDGLEDFALKSDQGGNGGPMYKYYLQTHSRQFDIDPFLTDSMSFFPKSFNKHSKSLTTLVHASAVSVCSTTYTFNSRSQKWKKTHREIIGDF